MEKEENILSSLSNDIDLFKTPLLTRKQYAVSILKLSLLVALLLILFLLFLNLGSVVIILSSIIFIPFLSFMLFYFNILFIKRYLNTSLPLFLLFFIPILYTLSCSFGMVYEYFIWESPIKWFFSAGIWLLPALLLFILVFIMPSSNKERPIITKIKNSLYIKKNILYPINNILTLKFKNRINSKQFIYGLLFTFIPLLLFLLHKDIIELLKNIYTQILHFKNFAFEAHEMREYHDKYFSPLLPVSISYGTFFFILIGFLVLYINSYKNISKNKVAVFIIGLILVFILPYSFYMFYGYMVKDYEDMFNSGRESLILFLNSKSDRYLLLVSIILLFIYYKLISVKNNLKTRQINRISFKEYIIKVIVLAGIYMVLQDVLYYVEHNINFIYLPDNVLSLPDIIYLFVKIQFIYCMLYYTMKRINNAIINKLVIISFIIYMLLPYYINFMSVYILIYILLLIIAGAYIPKYASERKYVFNNEKYKKLADYFNISNKIENILFFKLKRVISIREFILSFIFILIMYIYIIPFNWLKYMLINMTIYLPTEVPSENGYVTDYFISPMLYMYIILVVYSIFVLMCNGIYTIYMKRKGVING